MLDAPDLLFPGPPIVVGAVAFHLMGRYRDSPGEIGGEVEGRFWSWRRLEHLLGLRGQTGCACAPGFDGQLGLQEYVAHTSIWSGLDVARWGAMARRFDIFRNQRGNRNHWLGQFRERGRLNGRLVFCFELLRKRRFRLRWREAVLLG